jgi:hypothetical protein
MSSILCILNPRQLFRTRRRRLRVASYELRGKNAFVPFFYRDSLRFYPPYPQPATRNRLSFFFDGGFCVTFLFHQRFSVFEHLLLYLKNMSKIKVHPGGISAKTNVKPG